MEKLTLGEFREFTNGLSDDYEIRASSIQIDEQRYHTEVCDITSSEDSEGNFVILEPAEIEVSNNEEKEKLEDIMQRFIMYASDRRKYLVISDNEDNAKIIFSQNLPSLKIKSITETKENIFNIVE